MRGKTNCSSTQLGPIFLRLQCEFSGGKDFMPQGF